MPVSVTLATLRNRVRFLGDFDNSRFGQPSQSVSDARLDEVINDALRATYDLFLDYRSEQFVRQQTTPSAQTIPNFPIMPLSGDFYRLFQVEILDGGNHYPLRHINLREGWRYDNSSASPRDFVFHHAGDTLFFHPTPTGAYNLRVWYAPSFQSLLLTTDTFDGINGFERLAVARAIVDLKMREGMPAMEWVQKVKQYTEEVMADAGEADRGQPFLLNSRSNSFGHGHHDGFYGWWS